jgi:two-component system, response regulator PdtaR
VVEDEPLIRMAVAEMLRDSGLRVFEAASADEAMAFVRTGARVDLVFSDIDMPGAMNGAELGRRLRAEFPAVKLVLTSGSHGEDGGSNAPFIAKPYRFADVARRLQALLLDERFSSPLRAKSADTTWRAVSAPLSSPLKTAPRPPGPPIRSD